MEEQTRDSAARGGLITPEQAYPSRLSELESRTPANPPVIGIGIARSSSGPREGETVFVTTPALEAQREAARQAAESGTQVPAGNPALAFTWGGYFHAIGLLMLMLVVLWAVLRLVRRFGKGRFLPNAAPLSRNELFLEGSLPLGPNRSICVVRFLDRRLVLGVTERQITFLTEAGTENFSSAAEFTEYMENADIPGLPDAGGRK